MTIFEKQFLRAFAVNLPAFTNVQYWQSYANWWRGGKGWDCTGLGGTYQMQLIMWYQHVYKPKSKEYRPKIIIEAVLKGL
jgi:hypothetical protein